MSTRTNTHPKRLFGISIASLVLALLSSGLALGQISLERNPRVVDQGRGWKLLEVREEGAPPGAPGELMWMVNRMGVNQLPVSQFIRNELLDDFESPPGPNTDLSREVIFVGKTMAEAVEAGTLPPGYEIYEDAAGGCFGWNTKHKTDDYQYSGWSEERNFELPGALNGNFSVEIPVEVAGAYDFTYKIKKFACVPYKFKFVSAEVNGSAELSGTNNINAEATITGHWEDEWKLFEPELAEFTVWLGPIPVFIDVTLPVHAGFELDATLTGQVEVGNDFGASGSFSYICTSDGCTGSNTFYDNFDIDDVTASIELDIYAKGSARIMAHVSIYSDSFAYVEAGLNGFVTADVWGYLGNSCGDGDGDGQNETVRALVADLNWGWDIVYGIGGFFTTDRLWYVPQDRDHLGWWDLLGQGGSTALSPMLLGPGVVEVDTAPDYTVKMRPCYPYTDGINIKMTPGEWTGPTYLDSPQTSSITVSKVFPQEGFRTIKARAQTDALGRRIKTILSRTIEVTPPCPTNTHLSVSLTDPAGGDYIWGNVQFSADANDDLGVAQVKFLINGSPVCTDSAEPWACDVDVSGYSTGNYTLKARAFGVCGNTKTSSGVNARIVSNPEMAIEEPSTGETVSGMVTVSGWATDPDGVQNLIVKIDGQNISSTYGINRNSICQSIPVNDPGCPGVGYEATFNSANYNDGSHALQVRATDASGMTTVRNRNFIIENSASEHILTVAVMNILEAEGYVWSTPGGIECGSDCEQIYNAGQTVTLHTDVENGEFLGWLGDCSGDDPDLPVLMDADKHCIARFRCELSVPECLGLP